MKLAAYPEYKDSGQPFLGEIPAHWNLFRNGRLLSQRNETGFGELPILEVSLKTGVRVRDMDDQKRKQVMADREKYKRAAQGDIAYNMMRMWQGAVGVAPVDGLVSPAYVVVRPFPEVDCRYFSYLFRTESYMNEVDAYSRGIVKDRNRLYWQDFKRMPSPVPPVEEQRHITRFLDAVGSKTQRFIRNKRRLIELLKEQKQNVINQAVTRGLNPNVKLKPSGVEWIEDIPEHWDSRKLLYASSLIVDGTHFSPPNSETGDFLYITAKNIKERGVILENVTYIKAEVHAPIYRRCPAKKGDVLYIKDGATAGIACVNQIESEFSLLSSVALIKPKKAAISADYLVYQLNCQMLKNFVLRNLVGGAMTRFTIDLIKKFPVICPPVEEQAEIVKLIREEIAPIDQAITRAQREIELMREYRTRLISDVVTGQVDVRGIEVPEVAEEELLALDEDTAETDDVIDDEGATDEAD